MKTSYKVVVVLAFILLSYHTKAQTILTEGNPEIVNDIEFGYLITNIQSKEDYERYEIKFYATNNGCSKFIPLKQSISFSLKSNNILCEFSCLNATGKRLTSKGRTLKLPDWYYRIQNDIDGKGVTGKQILIGYTFKKGQTISESEIILTPKGEKPQVKLFTTNLEEF